MGIGLAIAKALVQMHGGEIRVSSDGPGKGCTCSMVLPITESAEADEIRGAPAVGSGKKLRVLVIDDNESVSSMLKYMLEAVGHDVQTAADGRAGISATEAFRPDVILCDIAMPEMNGFEFARKLRPFEWANDIRLIACSGNSGIYHAEQGHKAGFEMVLTKPVELKTLNSAIRPGAVGVGPTGSRT